MFYLTLLYDFKKEKSKVLSSEKNTQSNKLNKLNIFLWLVLEWCRRLTKWAQLEELHLACAPLPRGTELEFMPLPDLCI